MPPTDEQAGFGPAIWQMLAPAARNWAAQHGMVLGDFQGGRNLYDVLQDAQFQDAVTEASQQAAQADRPSEERTMRGLAQLAGFKWTPELANTASKLSGGIAEAAPYLRRVSPRLWDQLHGGSGSAISLAEAAATAARDSGLPPAQAAAHAQQLYRTLYPEGDARAMRGFDAGQTGQLYQEAVRRGLVSPTADPATVAKGLTQLAGPLSAIQDALAAQGHNDIGMDDLFGVYDTAARGRPSWGTDQLEHEIRVGDMAGRQGGEFAAAYRRAGPVAGAPPLEQLANDDIMLRQQAADSPLGNLVASTARIGQTIGFTPGSPGATLWQQMQAGQVPDMDASTWQQTMAQSGLSAADASALLNQTASNQNHLTPDLVEAVRRAQYTVDVKPRLHRSATRVPPPANSVAGMVQAGEDDQVARDMGYRDMAHVRALHEHAVSQMGSVRQQIQQAARASRDASGLGKESPLARMVGATQEATADTTLPRFMGRVLGGIPQEQLRLPRTKAGGESPRGKKTS